jgi:hypothetical protein
LERRVLELYLSDEVCVPSEQTMLGALVKWTDHAKPDREEGFAAIFTNEDAVRISRLSLDALSAMYQSPRDGHEVLVKIRIGDELLRRQQKLDDPTRPRRYGQLVSRLAALPTACERTLQAPAFASGAAGHTMAMVPFRGDKVISGRRDGTTGMIHVWSATSFACEHTVPTPSGVMSLLVFGDLLFVGMINGGIQVINTTSWVVERTLQGHTGAVRSLRMCGDLLVSGSSDGTIRVWSTATWACERTLSDHANFVVALLVMGDKLISGSADTTIKIWNTTSWTCERTLTDHSGGVYSLASADGGRKLLSCSCDSTVKIWDATSWECERTLNLEDGGVSLLLNGDTAFAGLHGGGIEVWNWQTGERVRTLEGHDSETFSLAVIDGKLWSGSWDDAVKVWA